LKKIISLIIVFVFSFVSLNFAYALTKNQKAAILAKFNQQEKDMIFETQIDF
jgi:hypothetical protein